MKRSRLIYILVMAVLFIVFVAQNSLSTATRFLFWTWTMPKAMLICLSVLLGVILGVFSRTRK